MFQPKKHHNNKSNFPVRYNNYSNSYNRNYQPWNIKSYEDPDEKSIFIEEPRYYWTPSDYQINNLLKLRNLPVSNVDIVKEMSRFFYHKMVRNKNYVKEEFLQENLEESVSKGILKENSIPSFMEKHSFYLELWKTYVPGWTPLEKAINMIDLLINKKKESDNSDMDEQITNPELLSKVVKDLPDEKEFINPDLENLIKNRKEFSDFKSKVKMLKKISLVESFGKTFEIIKTVNKKRILNSEKTENRKMIEYSDLINSPLYQRILPTFNVKLLTKDLIVNMPIETKESKQKIIFLVDFSGSMDSIFKQKWVLAILADRLSYCMREECEIFFSYFLTASDVNTTFKFTHIYNKETAEKFFKNFDINPNGGDTEVGKVIDKIRKEIENNKKLFNLNIDLSKEKPEILVVNDGQIGLNV